MEEGPSYTYRFYAQTHYTIPWIVLILGIIIGGCSLNDWLLRLADPVEDQEVSSPSQDAFSTARQVGHIVTVSLPSSVNLTMVYANNRDSITFPYCPDYYTPVDTDKITLTRKFFLSETEVTNAQGVKVLQWALDTGKIVTATGAHNEVNAIQVKYGNQLLVDLNQPGQIRIGFNPTTQKFWVEPGYENHPINFVTWYGAILFCNWLTEMIDGHPNNLVYSGIDTTWTHEETVVDYSKTGFRLPSSAEWEYAARYLGTNPPTLLELSAEYIAQNLRGGHPDLTPGYYWTPATYASGAWKDTTHEAETRAVAWCFLDPHMPYGEDPMPVKTKNPNQLGLYDMSGNVYEWCFDLYMGVQPFRIIRGHSFSDNSQDVKLGVWVAVTPTSYNMTIGLRLARTQ